MDLKLADEVRPAPQRRRAEAPGCVLGRRELPLGRADLPACNPLLREPLPWSTSSRDRRQCPTTPGLNFVYAHFTSSPATRPQRALRDGTRSCGPGWSPTPIWKGPTARLTLTSAAATRRDCGGCSGSSRSRAASRATWRPRRRARSTRAVSSATRCCTPTAPSSTTPICWRAAWSVTARPRPTGRWPRAGTRTSSSTRRGRRGAADPPQRLQDRQPDRAGEDPRARAAVAAGGLRLRAPVRRGIRTRRDVLPNCQRRPT